MIQKAKYIGMAPMFGVQPGEIREIDVFTINSEHGTPYIWVKTKDADEYMMPYVSVLAMLSDWRFSERLDSQTSNIKQEELVDRWLDVYVPSEEPAIGDILPVC